MEVRIYPEEFLEPITTAELISGVTRDLGVEYRVLRYLTETAEMTERMRGFDREGRDRYRDIRPYIDNFVCSSEGAYVNASLVNGFEGKKLLIGQAPMQKYISEWYSMICKEQIRYIVCLTVDEDRQCHRYWPKEIGQVEEYGRLRVKLDAIKDETGSTGIIKRSMSVQSQAKEWRVEQFQYIQWPDHGVPEVSAAKRLVEQVLKVVNKGLMVHCSAGVGRAGTLVAILNCLAQIKETGKVSVLEEVVRLRKQRPMLVQTTAQYELIYDVLRSILSQKT